MIQSQAQFQPPPGPPPQKAQQLAHLPNIPMAAQQQPLPNIPMMMISATEVRSAQTNTPIFAIAKSAALGSMSKKSLLTIVRPATGEPMGTVRFTSLSSSIEMSINGATTKLKEDGTFSFRYYFHPTCSPGVKWWWSEDGGDLKLTDSKNGKGRTIATVSGSLLACEQSPDMTEMVVDEIVVSAVAAFEKNKRKKGEDDIVEEVLGAVFG